ncbi:SRPBCC family protein [Flavisphingomonas formosensis]|uniref:SRPBCC family protein n=1 Tax=Flavisphingomonas formosensis TaxID=861534 RepID=UPI0012F8BD53|nr:DUF4440 domain-containing protein [Sphingomonas formosensis]
MGKARVVRRFDAPAEQVWALLSWRGMARLAGEGLFEAVRFESEDSVAGATKSLRLASGLVLRERLEWIDEPGFGYGYRIVDGGALPITDYVGSVRVTRAGPDACTVLIRNHFAGLDVADDIWAAEWESMETGLLDAIAALLPCPETPGAEVKDSIAAIVRSRSDRFEADFAAGDATALVANYYVETPRVIMPGAAMLEGRAAVEAMFAGLMQDFGSCRLRQIDVSCSGDLAHELGEATVSPRDPAASPLAVRYSIVWTCTGGDWRVATDFFAWDYLGLDRPYGS